MTRYYFFTGKNPRVVAGAFAPKGTPLAFERISEFMKIDELPFELQLTKISLGKNGLVYSDDLSGIPDIWLDLPPQNMTTFIVSERLRELIDKNVTGYEGIDWIKARVNGNGEQRIYYVLRFNKMHDIIEPDGCLYNEENGDIIVPCFSLKKLEQFAIFTQWYIGFDFWRIPTAVYVSEKLKKEIQKHKMTGVKFELIGKVK